MCHTFVAWISPQILTDLPTKMHQKVGNYPRIIHSKIQYKLHCKTRIAENAQTSEGKTKQKHGATLTITARLHSTHQFHVLFLKHSFKVVYQNYNIDMLEVACDFNQ